MREKRRKTIDTALTSETDEEESLVDGPSKVEARLRRPHSPLSTGKRAPTQPLMPADITRTSV